MPFRKTFMAFSNDVQITEGMRRYIDRNNIYLADRERCIREVVKKWKFDTISVHGLYTVRDAIEDCQGAIIKPIFMNTAQAYRDSDEMAAALACKIPTWCYSRIASPPFLRRSAADLAGNGLGTNQERCHQSGHINPPATG